MARIRATATTIPEDIIVEIVTTLPIKSVGRCMCVCKRWWYLFSGPKFAKSHMQSAFERRTLSRRLVLITHDYELLDLDLRDEKQKSSLLREGQLNAPFKKPEHSLSILGSCNGLVACLRGGIPPRLYTKGSLFIWNPSTGFYKEIAGQDNIFFRPAKGLRGFGHVSCTDDYKVVLGWGGRLNRGFAIFSLRTRTWNTIKSTQMGDVFSPMQSRGLLLREALHWLASSNYEQDNAACFRYFTSPIYVFALDLEKEEFRKMQLPSSSILKLTYNSRPRLGVSCEGCLYIMQYPGISLLGPERIDDYVDIDFWVMREYGNSESWTRSVTLRLSDEPDNPIYLLEPILLMESCAFVMNRTKYLCHPKYMFAQDKNKAPAATDMYMVHDHNNKEEGSLYVLHSNPPEMIVYEESLSEYEEGQKALIIYVPQGLITLRSLR